MALGLNQPLKKWVSNNLPSSKGRPERKADLIAICEPTVYKMWDPRYLITLYDSKVCYRDRFTTSILLNKAIMGPSTQQLFFSSSDVIATTCFDHTIIIRRQTVVYCRKRFAWLAIPVSWISNHELWLPWESRIVVTVGITHCGYCGVASCCVCIINKAKQPQSVIPMVTTIRDYLSS
jgi:hypothetical protein